MNATEIELTDLNEVAQQAARHDVQKAWVECNKLDEEGKVYTLVVKQKRHSGGTIRQITPITHIDLETDVEQVKKLLEGHIMDFYTKNHGDTDPERLLNQEEE